MSDSVLKYAEPTEDMKARYPRPADGNNASPWVSFGGQVPDMDLLLLQRVNASLGMRKQVHTMLVTFAGDMPRNVADEVLAAWQGPNKNELVTFMALDGTDVKWVEVHSWMDDTTLHAMLRDEIAGKPWSTESYAKALRELVPKYWKRKEFADFDYLEVSIHPGWIVGALVLSIIIVVAVFMGLDGRFERLGWQRSMKSFMFSGGGKYGETKIRVPRRRRW